MKIYKVTISGIVYDDVDAGEKFVKEAFEKYMQNVLRDAGVKVEKMSLSRIIRQNITEVGELIKKRDS